MAAVSTYKFKVLFACGDAFTAETAGSISIVIDGGTPEVVDLGAQEGDYYWKEFDAPSTSIVITASCSDTYVAIQVVHLQGTHAGLCTMNSAVAGSGAFHWKDRLNLIDAYAPKLTYISLGANDLYHGQTEAQYEANMDTILTKLATYGDIILGFYCIFKSDYSGLSAEEFGRIESFRKIANNLALKYNALFVDYHDCFIDGATAYTNGLMSDGIHLNDTGHEMAYQFLKSKVNI